MAKKLMILVFLGSQVPRGYSTLHAGDHDERAALNPVQRPDKDSIVAHCQLMRGDKLAMTFGYPKEYFNANQVYAHGYFLNKSGLTAYVKARVVVRGHSSGSDQIVASLIPPNKKGASPFLASLSGTIDDATKLEDLVASVEVDQVRFK
jgi:hypothetical protein